MRVQQPAAKSGIVAYNIGSISFAAIKPISYGSRQVCVSLDKAEEKIWRDVCRRYHLS